MKSCKTCNFCKKLYLQYGIFTNLRKILYCEKKTEIIVSEISCSRWCKKVPEYVLSVKRLKNVENDIIYLINHLEDLGKGKYYDLIFKP